LLTVLCSVMKVTTRDCKIVVEVAYSSMVMVNGREVNCRYALAQTCQTYWVGCRQTKILGEKVIKSDKCMGVSQLFWGTCPAALKVYDSTPMHI